MVLKLPAPKSHIITYKRVVKVTNFFGYGLIMSLTDTFELFKR